MYFVGISNVRPEYQSTLNHVSRAIKVKTMQKKYGFREKLKFTKEKIRDCFGQWLERAESAHLTAESDKKFLIIVIDGVDKHNSDGFFDMWPITSPKTVKLIYSCNRDSEFYKHLQQKSLEIDVEYPDPLNKFSVVLHFSNCFNYGPTDIIVKDIKKYGITRNTLYSKFLYHIFSEQISTLKISSLEQIRTLQSLFEFTLKAFALASKDPQEIYKFFAFLQITLTGFSESELNSLLSNPENLAEYLRVFRFILAKNGEKYYLANSFFKTCQLSDSLPKLQTLHGEAANVLELQSPERVEDITFHIYNSNDYTRLKNYISKITVFAQMFTPANAVDLFCCWEKLVENKFDPVTCYCKTLEWFAADHQLSLQDLSIILVLLSLFFKELSEFEKKNVCTFEHPRLVGHYELKEIDVLDEFLWIGNVMQTDFNGANEEVASVDNWNFRERFKEKIIFENNVWGTRQKEFYNYKRWVWIQFPWCAMDIHLNFSKILKALRGDNDKNYEDLVAAVFRIIEKEKKGLVRKSTSFVRIRQKIPNKMFLSLFDLNKTEKSIQKKVKILDFPSPKRKNLRGVSQSLSLKGLKPENALEHVQNSFLHFSHSKIKAKVQENHELRNIFNEKAHEYNIKKAKLEAISSQIETSNGQILAQERSEAKIAVLQERLNEICKNLNKIEAESTRFYQICDSCFKNPAKNDEWERKLNKKIELISKITEYEKAFIEVYNKESVSFESQAKDFRILSDEKLKSQHKALDKVLEQFLAKASINEKLANMEAKRLEIISSAYEPIEEKFKYNFKEKRERLLNIRAVKMFLIGKNTKCQQNIKKIQEISDVDESHILPELMIRLNRNEELNSIRDRLSVKLKRLENDRQSLVSKLNYLEKNEIQYEDTNSYEKIQSLKQSLKIAEKKFQVLQLSTVDQEITISTCEGILKKIWGKLEIAHFFNFKPEYYSIIFNQILEKTRMMNPEKYSAEVLMSTRSLSSNLNSTRFTLSDILSFNKV